MRLVPGPVRIYVVKNADGTPKRDPVTKQLVTDVIVQQRLFPKGESTTTCGSNMTSAPHVPNSWK